MAFNIEIKNALYALQSGIFPPHPNTGCAIDHLLRNNGSYSLQWGAGECDIALDALGNGMTVEEAAKWIIACRRAQIKEFHIKS